MSNSSDFSYLAFVLAAICWMMYGSVNYGIAAFLLCVIGFWITAIGIIPIVGPVITYIILKEWFYPWTIELCNIQQVPLFDILFILQVVVSCIITIGAILVLTGHSDKVMK